MHSDATAEYPELPSLDPGVVLLETDPGTREALHALVADRVLTAGGPAYWIDAADRARTELLARLAPSERVLDRVRVARGVTAFKHHALVQDAVLDPPEEPTLLVAPALDYPYRESDLAREEARALLVRSLAAIAGVARRRDCPALVTRTADGGPFADPIANAAGTTLRCRDTPAGPRFVGEDVETLVYPKPDGTVQTTLAFWREVLAERAAARGAAPATPPAPATAGR